MTRIQRIFSMILLLALMLSPLLVAYAEAPIITDFKLRNGVRFGMTFREVYDNEMKNGFFPTHDYLYDADTYMALYYQDGIYLGDVFCTRVQYNFDLVNWQLFNCLYVTKSGKTNYDKILKLTIKSYGQPYKSDEMEAEWKVKCSKAVVEIKLSYNEYETVFLSYSTDTNVTDVVEDTASSFVLRNDIHFGDDPQTVENNETFRTEYKDKTILAEHLQFSGNVFNNDSTWLTYIFTNQKKLKELIYRFSYKTHHESLAQYDYLLDSLIDMYGDSNAKDSVLKSTVLHDAAIATQTKQTKTEWVLSDNNGWVKVDLVLFESKYGDSICIGFAHFSNAEARTYGFTK